MTNRLADESSPYLKQHSKNPVDWYPWGPEALEKAKKENKPILLSIGYSACHWCHVMEHESFENKETAALMNQSFVNIKVDREERPDLDQIYQNVAQLLTHGGGWPLTVFLTPDLKPFFGGTYFPPEDLYGRAGFPRVLRTLADAYAKDHESVIENTRRLMAAMEALENPRPEENLRPEAEDMDDIGEALLTRMDRENGGFGSQPKFPNTMSLAFLWRLSLAKDPAESRSMREAVAFSLRKMAQGGIYDQLGGGFHRYSVDAHWSVPHFEKMLYDNALLLKLYSEVLLTAPTGTLSDVDRALFEETVSATVEYVLREMTSPEGGFYSTQDADSEGVEGKFFVWNPSELRRVLEPREAESFALRFGVSDPGNFEHGTTVLYQAMTIEEISAKMQADPATIRSMLERAKRSLLQERSLRIAPHRDEKILTAWNGLMISGLAWSSAALSKSGSDLSKKAIDAAIRAYQFAKENLTREQPGRLWSTYKDKRARLNAYLDDYAFLAMAALDLGRFTGSDKDLQEYTRDSERWIDVVRKFFEDEISGGFYFTSSDHEKLLQRPKTFYDQAIPSGSAVVIECMLALSAVANRADLLGAADEQLYRVFALVLENPMGMSELSCAALLQLCAPISAAGTLRPEACIHPHVFGAPAEPGTIPGAINDGLHKIADKTVVLCQRQTCRPPLRNAEEVLTAISELGRLSR